jgi:hypothetical protein
MLWSPKLSRSSSLVNSRGKEPLFADAYSGVDFPSAGFIPRSLWARFARQDAAEQGDPYSVIGL